MINKNEQRIFELEKRALVGDREAVIQLVSLFRLLRGAVISYDEIFEEETK